MSNYRIKRLLCGVRYDNVILRLWRLRVTNCAIVSPRTLHPVLTVAITGEPRSLMVSTTA